MKLRDTLLGLLVLALLAGGVYWARFRPSPPAGSSTGLAPGVQPEAGGSTAVAEPDPGEAAGGSSMAHRVGMAMSDEAMPDVTRGEASMNVGDVRVTLTVAPHPPIAFQENRFRVRVESANGPVFLEDGRISFEMKMPMGDHRYSLVAGADGWQEAEVVLPMCGSGNPRWYAVVEGSVAGQPRTARFRFDLAKPAQP